jgi:hypothetical protein
MRVKHINLMIGLPAALGMLSLTAMPAAAQDSKPKADKPAAASWTPSLTPDGQPDVQGYWVTKEYGMGCLSNPTNGNVGCVEESGPPRGNGRGGRREPVKAHSRIVDTPDGEIPYQPWAREREKFLLSNYFEPTQPEFIDPQQRCWPLGAVRQFTWHDVQILQYPGYVVLEHEGGHVYQIIPLDGRPHLGENIKLWMGDSRGHWEGNTLVIDVTNNNAKGRLSRAGDFSSDKVHHVVRMKFLDANNVRYEATFDDPSVYTRTWTFGFDMRRGIFGGGGDGPSQEGYEQWEEACVEGLRDVDSALRPPGSSATVSEKK